jgi:outer membrane protein TolC
MQKRVIAYVLFTSLAILFMQVRASAQQYTQQSLPPGASELDSNQVIEEKLVLIALTSPQYDATVHDRNNATHLLSKAKNQWLDLLAISTQFNETDFEKPTAGQQQLLYPKYFFGVTIPIGILFSRSSDVRIARENQFIAQDKQQELARSIRADVVTRYRSYVVNQEQLRMQTEIVNGEQVAYQGAQKDFKEGKISLETYNTASRSYMNEVTRRLTLVLQCDQLKIQLEQFLGMRLQDALRR